jgi:phage repressor protein C with HTH and peptisase S24 domain
MDIRNRIIKYIDYKGISKYRFYQDIGVSNGFLDKVGSIGSDKCEKISYQYPDINLIWLITGKGKMLKEDSHTNNTYIESGETGKPFSVPLIPIDAIAGIVGEDVPSIRFEDCEQYAVPEFEKSGCEFVIRVSGSSMYPKYSNGDILACKKVMDILFFQWGKIYVVDNSQGALVKRIYEDKEDTDRVMLVSENKDKYPPFSIPKRDIRSLSIVLGVIRME